MTGLDFSHLVYVDMDQPKISRYEISPKKPGESRFRVTHIAQAPEGVKAPPMEEVDFDYLEAFRLNPPSDWTVARPNPTPSNDEPQLA